MIRCLIIKNCKRCETGGHATIGAAGPARTGSLPVEVIDRQFNPLARAKVPQLKVPEARAMERQHFATQAGEHPPDLAIAPLGDDELRHPLAVGRFPG